MKGKKIVASLLALVLVGAMIFGIVVSILPR